MAREFDGNNQWVECGSDATIDQLLPKSISAWILADSFAAFPAISAKSGTNQWQFTILNTGTLRLRHAFSTTAGIWGGDTVLSTSQRTHVVISYPGTDTTSTPTMYVNGVTQVVTTVSAPVGTISSDAGDPLFIGSAAGLLDLDGKIANFCYDTGTWSAAEANRARWFGRPKGGIRVYHPFFTDKLTNEGTAVANGVLSTLGAAMVMSPLITPVVIPGSSMMGMGIGW